MRLPKAGLQGPCAASNSGNYWATSTGEYYPGNYWPNSTGTTPLGRSVHSGLQYPLPSSHWMDLAMAQEGCPFQTILDCWDSAWFGRTDTGDAPRLSRYSTAGAYERYHSGSLHGGLTSPSPPPPPHARLHQGLGKVYAATTSSTRFSSAATLSDPQSSGGTIHTTVTSTGSHKQPSSSQESSSQDPGQARSPATASPVAAPYQPSNIHTKSISLPQDLPSVLAASVQRWEAGMEDRPTLLQPSISQEPREEAGAAANSSNIHINGGAGSKVHGDAQAAALLGTWVHRQYRLLDPIEEKERGLQSQPGSIANAATYVLQQPLSPLKPMSDQTPVQQPQPLPHEQPQQPQPPQAQRAPSPFEQVSAAAAADIASQMPPPDAQPQASGALSESGSEVAAAEAAWRWRFTRRWQAEQQRAVCQQPDAAGSPDKTEEALAYLQAGGGMGWNMQVGVARTQSTDASALHSVGTQGLGSLLAGDMLLDDPDNNSMPRTAVLRGPLGDETATRHVNSINRRAVALLEQQAALERAAEARWASTLGHSNEEAWVGHHMATVEIDDWGTFRFLVLRVRGRSDRQRILVRGRNYCSEGQLTEEVNHKMLQLAARTGSHVESVEVMGGGVMEWRRERDRHLHLHAGWAAMPALAAAGGRPTCGQEVLNLAAVLTKQHLPVHFKVTIEGQ